ncbi:Gfo/Idh/MocA family oxidoreductase [Streptomyces sp. SID9727]|uniref:Gfo/Idh/MocA family protein n=1 Tax=Streptomyces sp. SID9727 TaxID=2706114 RepID=UPI0013C6AC04|nr:Gfo/Idh/MocA family oxidoreductase [Streptomyces sp. SID9727]NEC66326.1 Gfo/Idh/MocA family oxidoreductase [Streptomyces sp. SID9727]
MTAPLRVGVMGCANIAVRRMLPAFVSSPDIELAAVASRDPDKARQTAERFDCRAVHGYEELLELDDIQALYVPLPAALHARWVEAALRTGRHVLAEKPVTTHYARTSELFELASSRDLVLMENVMFVHHRRHEAVRRLIADGALGELRSFHAAFTIPPLADSDIRYRPELGGGALLDVGIYPLRAALHFLGPELDVVGAHLAQGAGRQVDTSGAALLSTPGGVTAQVTFGMEHAYRSSYELRGSEGSLTVDRAFTPPAGHVPVIGLHRGATTEEIRLEPHDQVAATVAAFAAAVRTGTSPDAGGTLRQAELLDTMSRLASRPPAPAPRAAASPGPRILTPRRGGQP